MKKRIIALITSFAVIVGLMASQGSYAWFVTAIKRAQSITIAVVNYDSAAVGLDTLEEDFYGNKCIYPGQNLVLFQGNDATLAMFNNSTISTQVRVRIEYTSYSSGSAKDVVYSNSDKDDLQVVFANSSQWLPYDNGMDGCCFYYVGPNYGSSTLTDINKVYSINPDVTSLEIIEKVFYKTDIDTGLYSGNEVTINIVFEAKQADYVGWSTLGEYQVATDVENA